MVVPPDRVRPGEGRRLQDERRAIEAVIGRLGHGAPFAGGAIRVRAVVARGATPHPLVEEGHLRSCATRGIPTWPRCSWTARARAPTPRRPAPWEGPAERPWALARRLWLPEACAIRDALGRALAFALLPGQGHEFAFAPDLLAKARRPGPIGRLVRDRGTSSQPWRQRIQAAGAEPEVPARPTHPAVAHDRAACRGRHRVENLRAGLKERRSIATRCDKAASSLSGSLHPAASLDRSHDEA